jgi:hypothetical protein
MFARSINGTLTSVGHLCCMLALLQHCIVIEAHSAGMRMLSCRSWCVELSCTPACAHT